MVVNESVTVMLWIYEATVGATVAPIYTIPVNQKKPRLYTKDINMTRYFLLCYQNGEIQKI